MSEFLHGFLESLKHDYLAGSDIFCRPALQNYFLSPDIAIQYCTLDKMIQLHAKNMGKTAQIMKKLSPRAKQ